MSDWDPKIFMRPILAVSGQHIGVVQMLLLNEDILALKEMSVDKGVICACQDVRIEFQQSLNFPMPFMSLDTSHTHECLNSYAIDKVVYVLDYVEEERHSGVLLCTCNFVNIESGVSPSVMRSFRIPIGQGVLDDIQQHYEKDTAILLRVPVCVDVAITESRSSTSDDVKPFKIDFTLGTSTKHLHKKMT